LRVTDALSGANRVMATVTYDNGITSDFNFIIDGDGKCNIDLDLNGFSRDMSFTVDVKLVDHVGNEVTVYNDNFNIGASDLPTTPPSDSDGSQDEVIDDSQDEVVGDNIQDE